MDPRLPAVVGVQLWNGDSFELITTFKGEGWVYSVAFTPDSSRFVSGGFHGSIKLWDVQGLSLIRKYNYEGHQGSISVMHCSVRTAIDCCLYN